MLAGTYVVRDQVARRCRRRCRCRRSLASWAFNADITQLPDDLAMAVRTFLPAADPRRRTPATRWGAAAGGDEPLRLAATSAGQPPRVRPRRDPGRPAPARHRPAGARHGPATASHRSRPDRLTAPQPAHGPSCTRIRPAGTPTDRSPTSYAGRPKCGVPRLDHLVDEGEPPVEGKERRLHRVDGHPAEVGERPGSACREQSRLTRQDVPLISRLSVLSMTRNLSRASSEIGWRWTSRRRSGGCCSGTSPAGSGRPGRRPPAAPGTEPRSTSANVVSPWAAALSSHAGNGRPSTVMSSTIRTPCPSRSAPHHWIASQMLFSPRLSRVDGEVGVLLGGGTRTRRDAGSAVPASAPAMSNPATPSLRYRTASRRSPGSSRRAASP